MDLALLGSITREAILTRAQVMRHRRIPVIQFSAELRQAVFELCA
jgi:hypothetical protein